MAWANPPTTNYHHLSDSMVPPNCWQHVAGIFDHINNIVHLYINGELAGTVSSGPNLLPSSNPFRIGIQIGPGGTVESAFNGLIDEVRVWGVARTAQEIQSNMQKQLTGVEPGLVGYWRFDEGTGLQTVDLAGANDAGTLTNGPMWAPVAGSASDCNTNGTLDECEGVDCNTNAVPDECEADADGDGIIDACDPDIDDDGILNDVDLCLNRVGLSVDCVGRPRLDLNGDCRVDGDDLQMILDELLGS